MIGISTLQLLGRRLSAQSLLGKLKRCDSDEPVVAYAHIGFPHAPASAHGVGHGGSVKYTYLDARFPHQAGACNILYVVSSGRYPFLDVLLKRAKALGIVIVWNQNGALFPSAYGKAAVRGNAILSRQLHQADYVFYQSEFARMGSDHFLGAVSQPSEVLYNAIDTTRFSPGDASREGESIRLLLSGSHNDAYRIPLALDVLRRLLDAGGDYELIVAGRIPEMTLVQDAIAERALAQHVSLLGPYTQQDAPDIYRQGDILLHTQYNDVCPSVVVEAMASGLPIAYSHSGGTPELVGQEAGVGVPAPLDWDTARPPGAEELSAAVDAVRLRLGDASRAARERAVSLFDLHPWGERHNDVFRTLLKEKT